MTSPASRARQRHSGRDRTRQVRPTSITRGPTFAGIAPAEPDGRRRAPGYRGRGTSKRRSVGESFGIVGSSRSSTGSRAPQQAASDQAIVGEDEVSARRPRRRSSARSVPTPGSTTARWTVPVGNASTILGEHERPLGDVLGRDRVTDVDDLRRGSDSEDDPFHRGDVRTVGPEVRRERQDPGWHDRSSLNSFGSGDGPG